MVADPALEQLAQRVIARYHLDALTPEETRQYIAHRMAVAGLKGPLPFTAGALVRIHQRARGIPRRINLLCDRALLGAYAGGLHAVDEAIVERAAAEVFGPGATGPAPTARRPRWAAAGAGALAGAAAIAAVGWGLGWGPASAHPLDHRRRRMRREPWQQRWRRRRCRPWPHRPPARRRPRNPCIRSCRISWPHSPPARTPPGVRWPPPGA